MGGLFGGGGVDMVGGEGVEMGRMGVVSGWMRRFL